jgi:peptidoglycan/xylan/chitin deacetylase (PgdA/CDA1 family)
LGNHTCNHAILAQCSPGVIAAEVGDAQKFLCEITGAPPASIVYPNGDFTSEVIAICKSLGLRLGFSSEPGKNDLPIDLESDAVMALRRFCLWGRDDLVRQCEWYRSDLLLHERLVRFRNSVARHFASPHSRDLGVTNRRDLPLGR